MQFSRTHPDASVRLPHPLICRFQRIRRENAIQSGWGVGIEMIQDPPDTFRRREILIHQQASLLGKIELGPLLSDVRFDAVFFSTRPTVSGEILSIWRHSTKRSANRFKVHRWQPVGGVLALNQSGRDRQQSAGSVSLRVPEAHRGPLCILPGSPSPAGSRVSILSIVTGIHP